MVDGNRSTVAEHSPTKRHNKVAWHAFGHSSERYHELWRRVLDETDPSLRLVKLGQLLHFVQDWEAHARYPVHLGHAKATILGHDPDSLARSEPRTRHGVQATLDHLAAMCGEMGRLPQGILEPDEALPLMLHTVKRDRLVLDLMAASDPAWRATPTGHLTKHGEEIMAENVERVERYILANLAAVPAKNVPADFRPGSDALGIPEPLQITFDLDGNPTGDLAMHVEAAGRQPVDDRLDPGDQRVRIVATKPTEIGWIVRVVVDNSGDREIEAGELTVHIVDGISEEPVGEATRPLPALAPGGSVEVELPIETTRPVEVALIGASAHADRDVDPYTSDVWVVHPTHRDRLESACRRGWRAARTRSPRPEAPWSSWCAHRGSGSRAATCCVPRPWSGARGRTQLPRWSRLGSPSFPGGVRGRACRFPAASLDRDAGGGRRDPGGEDVRLLRACSGDLPRGRVAGSAPTCRVAFKSKRECSRTPSSSSSTSRSGRDSRGSASRPVTAVAPWLFAEAAARRGRIRAASAVPRRTAARLPRLCGPAPPGSEIRGREGVAGVEIAGLQAAPEPAHPLGGRAVGERVGHDPALALALDSVVADGRGGIEPLLDVALLEDLAGPVCVVCPDAGQAVRLELHAHRQLVGLDPAGAAPRVVDLLADAEQGLDVVAHLVGDDVGLGEVTRAP